MRKWNSAVARVSALVFAGFVSVACATTVKSSAGEDTDGDSPPLLALIERPIYVDLPTEGARTLTLAQKQQFEHGRRVVSHTRPRCVSGAYRPATATTPASCSRTVDVQITVVEGAKYIGWTNGPRRPQLIAWLENLSPNESTFDGLVPGRQARYALVVDSGVDSIETGPAQGRKHPRLVLLQFTQPARYRVNPPTFTVTQSSYGHVFECHTYRKPFLSDIDFRPCDRTASMPPGKTLQTTRILATSLVTTALYAADDPVWFSCTSGCCTSAYAY